MSTTLTNGLKLPDKGSVDWYADMQNNYAILDGAVGTIAEHTSALIGKAPLVHTHVKSDITDFPAYGNAAGTICEGNDSRLSDARTPVAHTHTKSDVTDLFNSANTWTENNTFSKQICLTKVNDTSLKSQNSRAELGETNLSGDTYTQISFEDKNGDNFGYLRQVYGADGNNGFHFFVRNKFLNGVPDTTGTVDYSYFGLRLNPDKSKEAVFKASLRPYDSINSYNLGDATYQWNNLYAKQVNTQLVNGINPGALSFPNFDNADPIDFRQWDVTGAVGLNYYTPTTNGWLNISIWDRATNSIFVYRSGKERVGVFGNGSMASDGRIALLMPVQANATYIIIIKASANSDIYSANFFPCLGNV